MVAARWLKANLYCCSCNYADLVSSFGSALGYGGYIEVAATLVVLMVYLQMVRAGEAPQWQQVSEACAWAGGPGSQSQGKQAAVARWHG
jgi:hypothetical protein